MLTSSKKLANTCILFFILFIQASGQIAVDTSYLNEVKAELIKTWPHNRTINLVFHGHSVPSAYFKTPVVNTLGAYPFLTLKNVKEQYPYAVVNTITTAIGGENSSKGAVRFVPEVTGHSPDVVFIDYALNDRYIVKGNADSSIIEAKKYWIRMIKTALDNNYKVILLTPTPAKNVNILDANNILERHSEQIRFLADSFQIGLVDSYKAFTTLIKGGANLNDYMSQGNHPNELGHKIVADEIKKWF